MKNNGRIRGTTPEIEQAARKLRNNLTLAEARLWSALRNKQLEGLRFRCQHPVGNFILDFYCPSCKLVVEVDGEIHDRQTEYDDARTAKLVEYGCTILRFRNEQVMKDLPGVLAEIRQFALCSLTPPIPNVYTQVMEFSQVLTEPPPSPQTWGDKNFQSPPDHPQCWGSRGQGI